MHVVATAGHVDHGKSTLVRALTGTDPDRLAEERRRGLTIELGHAWTVLDPVGEVAFVDVPGHERFVATALAGVGPVPVAMLVVAADDPWMPQAAEHLGALDALGVRHGLLVATRADLADPGPVLRTARRHLAATSLAGVPEVAVSGRTGEGLDRLRAVLARVLGGVPEPDPAADVRLWVDRRFHVRGAGTVVTGTLPAGTIAVGDALCHDDRELRVRGLERLGSRADSATGTARVALRLGGRVPDSLGRGSALVTPGAFVAASVVDVRLDRDDALPRGPLLHVGAAMVATHARPLAPGLARLVLDRPLPLHVGDRAVVRDPGSRALWGAVVVDPAPPPLRRRGDAARRATQLAGADGTVADELDRRRLVRRSVLRALGVPVAPLPAGTVEAGDWLLSPAYADRLRADLRALADRAGVDGAAGLAPAEAAHALGLPDPALVAALAAPGVRLDRGRVLSEGGRDLPPAAARALDALRAELDGDPFAAPPADRLAELGLDPETVAVLHRAGRVLRLAPGVVLLAGTEQEAAARLRKLDPPFTASEARRAWGTSRRIALPLLAHLDAAGVTVRLADDTRRLRRG